MSGRTGIRLAAALFAVAALAGCGAGSGGPTSTSQSPPPTKVSVILGKHGVTITPYEIGSRSPATLDVLFTIANRTAHSSALQLHGEARDVDSEPIPAHGQGEFRTELPPSYYYVTADKVSTASEPVLVVSEPQSPR